MDPNGLHARLEQLHAELSKTGSVDAGSSRLLEDIMADIRRLTGAPENASLPERLEGVAVQFAAGHPALAESARRLVDLLGKIGV